MASRVYSSLRYMSFGGFSCCRAWAVVIQASVLQVSCSVGAAHGFDHCAACWIFPDEGLNLCPLHCQVDPHLPGKSWKSHLFRTVNEILLLLSFIHYIYVRKFFFFLFTMLQVVMMQRWEELTWPCPRAEDLPAHVASASGSLISPLKIYSFPPELQFSLVPLCGYCVLCTFLLKIVACGINSKILSKAYRTVYNVAPSYL